MVEPDPTKSAENPAPSTTEGTPLKQPAGPIPQVIKRKQSDGNLESSPCFKIRVLVRQLRPHFIEVLQTPDFRNCKASEEIRRELYNLMDLYKDIPVESIRTQVKSGQETQQKQTTENIEKRPQTYPPPPTSEKKPNNGRLPTESYIVGGSAFGWNFITFGGSNPAYYGVTKELFRVNQSNKLAKGDLPGTGVVKTDPTVVAL